MTVSCDVFSHTVGETTDESHTFVLTHVIINDIEGFFFLTLFKHVVFFFHFESVTH